MNKLTNEQLASYKNLASIAGWHDPEVILPLMVDEILQHRALEGPARDLLLAWREVQGADHSASAEDRFLETALALGAALDAVEREVKP